MDRLVKDKLKQKQIVNPHERIEVVLEKEKEKEKEKEERIPEKKTEKTQKQRGVTLIVDERDTKRGITAVEADDIMKKLRDKRLSKVTVRFPEEEKEREEAISKTLVERERETAKKAKKPKKLKTQFILEDEEEKEGEGEGEGEKEKEEMELVIEEEGAEGEQITTKTKTKRQTSRGERLTEKVKKGVAVLGPEEWVDIEGKSIFKRLPPKEAAVKVKLSSYYMANRKIFVNFINSFFERYKDELKSQEQVSCDAMRGQDNFSLLTHQKIVKDYLNLYTPYRGLLLYHGLGAGKTCSSIAIAEGMKSHKKVIIMTPKSLRENYMDELKKCGDFLYKKKQHWDWISDPAAFETLSSVLGLPLEYIKRQQGAWLVDVSKSDNNDESNALSTQDMKSLDAQINEMIQNKYTFINYNGLRASRLKSLTNDYEKNIFDNSVIIIDEAHNFISRIVNKLKREKEPETNKRGEKASLPMALSLKLYEFLLSAQNSRIVLLTGTPIINYPNEIAVLFNILRGYIKTWEIPLNVKTSKKISSETLQKALQGEKVMDFLDYSPSSKKLFITRNPLGFKNKIKVSTGYHGVTGEKKNVKGETVFDTDFISDDAFERKIIGMLREMDIDVMTEGIRIHNYKALPDKFDDFVLRFVDENTKKIKNVESFKKRILGLTSYFRSAQEGLLPRYDKTPEYYHVVKIPMSDYQFKLYEAERKKERTMESSSKKKKGQGQGQGQGQIDGIYKETSSTYRIFSRTCCNFVMPKPPGRPMPVESDQVSGENVIDQANRAEEKQNDVENEAEGEIEGEDALNAVADSSYQERIASAIAYVKEHSSEIFSKEALQTYSPKFLSMLENIEDESYTGLHLVYSQFRTLEGIGLFALTLEANGFARFKIKKNTSGAWELDIAEEDEGKPTFALYTGTESDEEKKIILKIYNGIWDDIPTQIATRLRKMANNNDMGEIIKVLMITSSGSEGINLRNTRYVHVMEPYWHPVRTEQVIGRARRICSHKDLPDALQTVEVFMYLMTFTKKQIEDETSLRLDLSKREPKIPLTSDEYLYEISTIKEEITSELLTAIKETSIDCAVYSRNSKENLHCISFGEPDNTAFSYYPNINEDQTDTVSKLNKDKITWTAKGITIRGIKYAARQMSQTLYKVYDLESYKKAIEKGGDPIFIGTLEIKPDGNKVFNMGV